MSGTLLERIPPQNLEAEQATLGAMLMERDAIAEVVDLLEPDDFYNPQHVMLYRAIVDLFNDSEPVDLVTLRARLQDRGLLENAGGTAYLLTLQEVAPTAAGVAYYARIVNEKATLRRLIHAAGEIRNLAQEPGDREIANVVAECEKALAQVVKRAGHEEKLTPLHEVIGDLMRDLEQQITSERHVLGIPTRLTRLDALISGWTPATYYLIGARPSIGKTAFLWQQAIDAARAGARVALFSLEMSSQALGRRLLARELHVPLHRVMAARLDRQEPLAEVAAIGQEARGWRFGICSVSDLSIAELRSQARRWARKQGGVDFVGVDYLQLLGCASRGNRNEQVTEISRGLRALANELNCALLVVSQLNRASEEERRPPRRSDLRDSGSLEQDADVILFLDWPYWEAEYRGPDRQPHHHMRRVDVAKQRNGPMGRFDLHWSAEYQAFHDLETRQADEIAGAEARQT